LNISCPNTRAGGMVYGSDPKLTEEVVAAAKKVARFPLIVKLSPNVTDIAAFARVAEAAGADALSLVNTFVGMAIDIETARPRLSNVTGGSLDRRSNRWHYGWCIKQPGPSRYPSSVWAVSPQRKTPSSF